MTRKRDNETGQFIEKYPPEEIVSVIDSLGGKAATSEVADEIGSNSNTAFKKLQRMEKEGTIDSRRVGGIRIWTLSS